MLNKFQQYIKNQKGSQLIEFLAVFPLIVFSFLLIWQIALAAYSVVVIESSARDGARVAAVGGNYKAAVERSASGLVITKIDKNISENQYGQAVTITVYAKLPTVSIPLVGRIDYIINANATIPIIDDHIKGEAS